MGNDYTEGMHEASLCNPDKREFFQEMNTGSSPMLVKSEILTLLDHEVRTSMRVIIGYARILGYSHIKRNESEVYLETIRAESEHLLYLFNEFFNFQGTSPDLTPSLQQADMM